MSAIRLTRKERAALKKLVRRDGSCELDQIAPEHAERFLRCGLIAQGRERYHITLRGQVEFLRQRYVGLRPSMQSVIISKPASMFARRAFG